MNDVPYERWVQYVENMCREHGVSGKEVLDVACGTGSIALPLLQRGFSVAGTDLSEDMLTVAQQKLAEHGFQIPLYQQDMRGLELPGQFDVVTIFCDSLNYLVEDSDVQQTFIRVREHIKDGGLFLFDVHSLYKIHHVFMDEAFTVNEDEIALIWNCFPGEYADSVEHEMTFFVQDVETGMYHRFDEDHVQRAYEVEELAAWLGDAGFEVLSVAGEYGDAAVGEEEERIFFAARKKS
nr:class I SAM-dependent methyltransferase [Ectobacillus ponti]